MGCSVTKSFPNMSVTGSVTLSGLNKRGLITTVTLNDTTWTALPPTALVDRNAMRIQNQSAVALKTEYDNTVVGFDGMLIVAGGEVMYDIKDNIKVYAKCQTGTVNVKVEELS